MKVKGSTLKQLKDKPWARLAIKTKEKRYKKSKTQKEKGEITTEMKGKTYEQPSVNTIERRTK